jgi:hypothetical protein
MADFDMTWAKADPDHVPPEIDTTQPSVARVYDAILGGKDNFAVDRAVAAQSMKAMGDGGKGALLNRAVLGRAVRYMVGQGISQFLDLGSGLPTDTNVHQVAQTVDPAARVVYVDNDPMVLAHARALLTSTTEGETHYVHADMHDAGKVLAEAAQWLDFGQPVGLTIMGVLGHVVDYAAARAIVAGLLEGLPSGSYLAINDSVNTSEALEEALRVYEASGAVPYRTRSPEEFAGYFDGLELIPPGVVLIDDWPAPGSFTGPAIPQLGALGRKR